MKSSVANLNKQIFWKVTTSTKVAEKTTEIRTNSSSPLVYKATQPSSFHSVHLLTRYLAKNVLAHAPGRFVVVKKPYGVSCVGTVQENGGIFENSVRDERKTTKWTTYAKELNSGKTDDVTISDCLSNLQKILREPSLSFCTGIKRYLSGAIVLPCNEANSNILKNCIRKMSVDSEPLYMYNALAITIGKPEKKTGTMNGFATFRNIGNHKEYIFEERKVTKRAKSGKFAVEGNMSYQVLGTRNGCSLVQFSVDKWARHLPRLMLSQMISPILGDSIYWRRMGEIDGKAQYVQPGGREHRIFIPSSLGEILEVEHPRSLVTRLPMFCHVYQTVFDDIGGNDDESLIASCPPPSHFMAMLELLQLMPAYQQFQKESETKDNSEYDPIPVRSSGETKY